MNISKKHTSSEQDTIFKSIFGDDWEKLPTVLKKHYANRPYSQDKTVVKGHLDVLCKPPLLWMAPLLKLLGQIPAKNATNIPVTVTFTSDPNSASFAFRREFYFTPQTTYAFNSKMLQQSQNKVSEIMRFGFSWDMTYHWEEETIEHNSDTNKKKDEINTATSKKGKVVLRHRGYSLHIFGFSFPIPLTLFLGKGYAEETAIDEHSFSMCTHINHPWWGKIYEYKGQFHFEENSASHE